MTNTILILGIILFLAYAVYDQVLMNRLNGKTQLAIPLKKQATTDTWVMVGLIVLTIGYGVQNGIEPLTLYLLAVCVLLCLYATFWRSPRLLLKEKGFFFGNIYFDYQKIQQINLAEGQIIVIDLKSGRRLLVRIEQADDVEKVVNFFGGYKGDTK